MLYLLMVPIGSFFFFLIAKMVPNDRIFMVTLVSITTLALGVAAYLFMANHEYQKYLRTVLSNNQCEVLAGKIKNFKPLPMTGRGYESFELMGHKFSYNDSSQRQGFGQTHTAGGNILNEGLQIRVCHYDGHILRLEIENDQ